MIGVAMVSGSRANQSVVVDQPVRYCRIASLESRAGSQDMNMGCSGGPLRVSARYRRIRDGREQGRQAVADRDKMMQNASNQ